MRKMREYVVRNKRVFIGLEDAKRTWKLCVRSGGIVVHELSLPAEYENLRAYLRTGYPGCDIRLIYEAGFGGFWLYDRLSAEGIACIVTPPNKVTQEKVNKVKTDRIDARRLARNLEVGDVTRCHIPDPERRADRQISRTLNQIQRTIVATKNRIRRFLDFHGLNGALPTGAWTAGHYRQVRELSLPRALQISLGALVRLLTELEAIRGELTAELRMLCTKERYREAVALKQSCPGVGWLSAIRFTLEWGELTRFADGKRLASFTGLTSREYSTGETIHRGRITGQSTSEVRAWLIQCAWRAIRSDPVLLHKFQRVWKNSGSKKKAIVAVARKLAVRIRAVELSHTPYSLGVIA
ncbi:IS110 family transposase [Candidatus Zixiibacteriota bacterium]